MSKWWNTQMASSSQALYTDPSMALETATVPDSLFTGQMPTDILGQDQYQRELDKYNQKKGDVQKKRSGFLGGILNFFDKADDVANNVTGGIWDAVQNNVLAPVGKAVWAPVDKLSSGAYWLYSEAVSQPLSTLILGAAQAQTENDPSLIFKNWDENYNKAEDISPGQAIVNSGLTDVARGEIPLTNISLPGGEAVRKSNQENNRNVDRMIYDTDYWRNKVGWTYTAGTGASDFLIQIGADPTTYITMGGSAVLKGVRSVKYVERAGELVRDQGAIVNTARKVASKVPGSNVKATQTVEDVAGSKKMTSFFDWAAGKSQQEIASHPIFGRGRRVNPFKNQIASLFSKTERDDMPLMYRYLAGQNQAASELMAKGGGVLDDLGRLSENRALVDSTRLDPEMLAYFASKETAAAPGVADAGKLFEPPIPRPTTAGPAQQGWDKTYGELAKKAELHKEAATAVKAGQGPLRGLGPAQSTLLADVASAETWKASKLTLMQDEIGRLQQSRDLLADALNANLGGKVEDFSATSAHLFGGLPNSYRAGSGAFRSTERAAEKKFANAMKNRKGRFSSDGIRKGFYGTPLRLIQSFGDNAPVGRVNHNDPDAIERVNDMLREVPGLAPGQHSDWLTRYSTAGDKVAKSRELKLIHQEVLQHMAERVHGLDGEVARVITGMTEVGVDKTINKLLSNAGKTSVNAKQAFSSAVEEGAQHSVDYVDDGVGYVVSPLAKTQLSQTDTLLPIRELNRVFARNSGSIKTIRKAGGTANDAVKMLSDNFGTAWKAATLLRPAYVPRMISEEAAASAIKFGFMSRLVADPAIGAKNFVANRGQQVWAELGQLGTNLGKGAYSPTTGKGAESIFTVSKVGDEELAQKVTARRNELRKAIEREADPLKKQSLQGELDSFKLRRVRVNKALPIVRARIKMESEQHAGLQKDLDRYQREYDGIIAQRAKAYEHQGSLDSAASDLAAARQRVQELRDAIKPAQQEIAGTKAMQPGMARAAESAEAQAALHAQPVDELTQIHREAQKFLKQAEKAAGQNKVRWGDKDWKYDAGQLDKLRAWEAKAAKTLRTQQTKVGGAKSAATLARQMNGEFDGIIANLTGDKNWLGTALGVAEKRAAEARQGLGEAAAKAHRPVNSGDRMTSLADKLEDIKMRMADHENIMGEFADYANEILRTAVAASGRRLGEGTFEAFGQRIPQAFSSTWENSIPREQISADTNAVSSAIYARQEAVDMGRMVGTGNWDYITPDKPQHMAEWLHALNRQFKQDDVFALVAKDGSGQEALKWLKTPAGAQHLRDLGIRGRDPEKLVSDIRLTMDKYLPEETGLRAKLAEGEDITAADLTKAVHPKDYPTVHGQEILEKTGLWAKDQPGNMLDRMIQKGFERLGSIPSDLMSRHPVYLRFQEARYKEILGRELSYMKSAGKDLVVSPKKLEEILHQSDGLARKDMKQIVYDPQRTTASEALRFIAPFFSAHVDGLSRWGGLIAEKPKVIGRLSQIYNAPVAANMVTDTQGNHVDQHGYAHVTNWETGKVEKKFVGIQDRVFQLKAPWDFGKKNVGTFPIKIQAMNTILPGDPWFNPGSGPLVQIAGSQIAKASPQAGDFLQWAKIMPYGPSGSISDAITPKYMRTLWDAYKGADPGNEEYGKAYLAIWNRKQMEYQTGEENYDKEHPNATPEQRQKALGKFTFSQKDIEDEAKNFLYLNVIEAWGSPAQSSNTPLTGSPYQFFVDQLAQMRKADPENGAQQFIALHGSDYAGFTATLNKGMGIAATISADQQAEKYKDQISADPDMAAFWVGDVYNGGPFSSSVYAKQQEQSFGGQKARAQISPEEAITNSQITAGWNDYRAGKAYIDSLLIRNGFKSYSQKGAEGLNQARQQLVAGLSGKYPGWGEAFNVTDRGKVPARIQSFEMAIQDDKLSQDPTRGDIPVLRQYLEGRRWFKQQLALRGLNQISYTPGVVAEGGHQPTGEAADVAAAWDQFTTGLINSSIQFGDLYNRYLSSDELQG